MCGIIGYVGSRPAQPVLLNCLKRLEYRGYDSSGMAVFLSNKAAISVRKRPGKIAALERLLKNRPLSGTLGISHTRWSTHGEPNQKNAHPHVDCDNTIALAHNGIIENYAELKESLLKKGHSFRSQTDTEVIVHLVEQYAKRLSLKEAVRKSMLDLRGSFAIAVISKKEPGKLIGARLGSPLVVGLGKEENFLASDIPAILDHTKDVILLEDNELVELTKNEVNVSDINGKAVDKKSTHIDWDVSQAEKQGYEHFMLKEINEQPRVLDGIIKYRVKDDQSIYFEELEIKDEDFARAEKIIIVACGTAYHAGICARYVLEQICGLPVSVELSSEFRYKTVLANNKTLVIAISQSGETADTIAAVREAKNHGAKILSICNVLGSSLSRESDGVIYTHAGPEIGVASTKAYTAQLMILNLFTLYLSGLKNTLVAKQRKEFLQELIDVSDKIRATLKNAKIVKRIARRHSHFGSFLYLGRNVNFPSALEGALKLKEISYIPAEGYAAGEMKHGPIALIDEYRAVICIAADSFIYEKMVSNIQEIKARRGRLIAVATEGNEHIAEYIKEIIYVPAVKEIFSPLVVVVPLQLFAYYVAVRRGCDVDQPRNLAKSVTVE